MRTSPAPPASRISTARPSTSARSLSSASVSASLPPRRGAGGLAGPRRRRRAPGSRPRARSGPGRRSARASAAGSATASDGAGMAGGEPAVAAHGPAPPAGRLQQAQGVGHMAAALADRVGDLVLGAAEPVDQRAGRPRPLPAAFRSARWTFSMMAISSTSVVVELAHQGRHGVQAGPLRRAPAALAGDDLDTRRRSPARAAPGSAAARPSRGSTAASSSSSASAKRRRGWSGLAWISSIGISRDAAPRGAGRWRLAVLAPRPAGPTGPGPVPAASRPSIALLQAALRRGASRSRRTSSRASFR